MPKQLIPVTIFIFCTLTVVSLTYCHDKTLDKKFAVADKHLADCKDGTIQVRNSQAELLTYQLQNELVSYNDYDTSYSYINFLQEKAVSQCVADYKTETAKIIHEY